MSPRVESQGAIVLDQRGDEGIPDPRPVTEPVQEEQWRSGVSPFEELERESVGPGNPLRFRLHRPVSTPAEFPGQAAARPAIIYEMATHVSLTADEGVGCAGSAEDGDREVDGRATERLRRSGRPLSHRETP